MPSQEPAEGSQGRCIDGTHLIAIGDEDYIALIPSFARGEMEPRTIGIRQREDSLQRSAGFVCIKRLEPGTQARNDGRVDGRISSDVAYRLLMPAALVIKTASLSRNTE